MLPEITEPTKLVLLKFVFVKSHSKKLQCDKVHDDNFALRKSQYWKSLL